MSEIKNQILKLLHRSPKAPLSGVKLSQQTGISRVGVWKHISALKENGFDIESGPKGYRLARPDDLLLPFCFEPHIAPRICHYPEIGSTMDQARSLAREGAHHLTCVVAENQTQGRGRLNRQWDSSRGGLWFTLILTPDVPPPMAYLYNFAASLSLSRTLNRLFDLDVRVKWPNDLLLEEKKLVGVLSEMETRADMLRFLLLGIGINANNPVSGQDYQHNAISLTQALGRPVSRREILSAFLTDFEAEIQDLNPHRIMAGWKTATATLGREVKIQTLKEVIQGRAVDVDRQGTLIVKDNQGNLREINYGDCFHT